MKDNYNINNISKSGSHVSIASIDREMTTDRHSPIIALDNVGDPLNNSHSLNIDNINNIGTGGFPDFSAKLKLPSNSDVVALKRLSRFAENDNTALTSSSEDDNLLSSPESFSEGIANNNAVAIYPGSLSKMRNVTYKIT